MVSILTARLLGPERYGIYNIILWLSSVVSLVVGMGLNFAVTKFTSEFKGLGENDHIGAMVRYILWIEISISIVTSVLLVLRSNWISDYFFNPDYSLAFSICFAGLVPGICTAIYSSALEGLQRFHYFLYYSAVITPLSLITKVIILVTKGPIEYLLWSNLVFSVINTVFFRWALYHERIPVQLFGKFPLADFRKKLIRYNFSISAIMILDKIIWDKSENFFLGKYCLAKQAGFFNAAYGLSNKFTQTIGSTFWKVLFPFMSERVGAKDTARMKRTYYLSTRYLAFLAFPVAAAGMVLAYPLIKFTLGPEYLPVQRVLQVFFFCNIFGHLAIPQAAVLYAVEKQNFIIKYGIFLAVINLVFDYLYIPLYGALGAAVINGIIRIFAFVGGIIYTIKIADIKLPMKSLFKIFYSSVIMAVLMQVVIKVNKELLGFILSIPVGIVIYLGTSMFAGTFEKEDSQILGKITSALPWRVQKIFTLIYNRVGQEPSKEINIKAGP
jgi:O-antigen/teichoic acid export membrane protein